MKKYNNVIAQHDAYNDEKTTNEVLLKLNSFFNFLVIFVET